MCLIVVKEANQKLSNEFVTSVMSGNSDGWGIMWFNRKGRTCVQKGLDRESFNVWYARLQNKKFIAHFRYRTDGLINLANAHPYPVLGDVHMMHNGVLGAYRTTLTSELSDTANFIAKEVRPLLIKHGEAYADTPEFEKEMEKYTGASNKLTFITKTKFIVIEPRFWTKSLSGLLCSNTYAYSVDNPNHYGREYGNVTRYSTFRAGDGDYCKTPANTNTTAKSVYAKDDYDYTDYFEDMYGARQSSNWYAGASEERVFTKPSATTESTVKLIADNTKSALLDENGEPIVTAKSKSIHSMTDAEFRASEAAESEEDFTSYDWLQRMSLTDIRDFMTRHPETMAHAIKSMAEDIFADPKRATN